jgi:hypothetical protein
VRAVALIPSNMPLLKDPKFRKDREDFTGRGWSKENVDRGRSEALMDIKGAFEFLESTILADGRDWVLKTEGPSLADIEGMCCVYYKGLLRPGWRPGGGCFRRAFRNQIPTSAYILQRSGHFTG